MRRRNGIRGQALVEFTFVGIPVLFLLISVFEISRGMWVYQTLAYAAKAGVRYAIVHGGNCANQNGNTCSATRGPTANACDTVVDSIRPIAEVIRCAGVGLDPVNTMVTFTSIAGSAAPCSLETSGANACRAGSPWPATGADNINDPITITITTPFNSAIAMFWPGASPVSFASGILAARSSDRIQY